MVNFELKSRYNYEDLLQIVHILRSPGGCPWDQEQTHKSIRRDFLEEAYEAAEAIDNQDFDLLKEELGDVLLQVVFHARMAEEAGRFTFDDVVNGVAQKLVFRHPHVFGTVDARDADGALVTWEAQKQVEKDQRTAGDTLKNTTEEGKHAQQDRHGSYIEIPAIALELHVVENDDQTLGAVHDEGGDAECRTPDNDVPIRMQQGALQADHAAL